MSAFDPEAIKKATEGGAEHIAAQQAERAAEDAAEVARQAAIHAGYPRVLSSGGARDDTTVYPSEFTLEYDTEAEALAAVAQARADGRHVSMIDSDTGAFVVATGGGYSAAIELDPSTRYSTSDHTGGR